MKKRTELKELEQKLTRDLSADELMLIVGGQVDVITGASPPPHVSSRGN